METDREVVNLTFDVFILFFIYIKHLKHFAFQTKNFCVFAQELPSYSKKKNELLYIWLFIGKEALNGPPKQMTS